MCILPCVPINVFSRCSLVSYNSLTHYCKSCTESPLSLPRSGGGTTPTNSRRKVQLTHLHPVTPSKYQVEGKRKGDEKSQVLECTSSRLKIAHTVTRGGEKCSGLLVGILPARGL